MLLAVCKATDLECPCIPRIAAGLGGGLGLQGEACGAVTGGVLVVGLTHGSDHLVNREEKDALHARAGEFVRRFADVNGELRCRDLIDLDVSTVEGLEEYRARNLAEEQCQGIVSNAVRAILGLVGEWNQEDR